jgi:kynurenine formamidase
MIIDFTMPIEKKTPTFPDDQKQIIKQIATVKKQGWNEKRITFNSHFSTHIDAPRHMLAKGKTLTDFPLETFVGEAVVINVQGQKQIETDLSIVEAGDIVFFFTGHSKKAYESNYFKNNPIITKKTAQELINKKIKIVGLDSFTPDNDPYPVHKMLFKKNILIVENLVNLKKVAEKRFSCYILPLKIKDADGAPCRVIGILN